MTIDELRKYRAICAEIADIKQQLSGRYVGDTVQSGSKHPYSVHNVRVEGYVPDGDTFELLNRLRELEQSRDKIEKYVSDIEDFQTKKMFYLKFIKERTYLQVAMAINPKMSTDCVKKRIYRYVRNH